MVVYRRDEFPDDTIYNAASRHPGGGPSAALIQTGLPDLGRLEAGFYYLWHPGVHDE